MLAFQRPPKPPGFTRKTARARDKIEKLIEAGRIPKSEQFDRTWKDFKDTFEAVQHGKCGYCEHDAAVSYAGDVEHYAPKAGIDELTGEPANPRTERYPRHTISALGYHCRAYDWDNYLFACSKCNGHKGNLFPIAEQVAKRQPCSDSTETALLLHPYEPGLQLDEHLRFDKHGYVFARTSRGRHTIDTCRLDRIRLIEARRRVASKIPALVEKLERGLLHKDLSISVEALSELQELGHQRAPFAGMVRIMVQNEVGRPWQQLMDLRDKLAKSMPPAQQ